MKVLIYTDLQATEGSARCRTDAATPLQRWRVTRFFKEIKTVAEKFDCEGVCDLGDTTDDRSFIYRATLDVMMTGLANLPKGLVKLMGNHEQLLKDGRISAESLFEPYFNHVGDGQIVGSTTVVYRSFTPDYAALNKDLQETARSLKKLGKQMLLLAHGDVKGARYASGEECSDGISLETLDMFDMALLGHVHNFQSLIKDKAWYIGSPFQQDFGEASQRKYVAILDTETLHVQFIEMKGFPEYRTVSFKDFCQLAKPTEEHRYKVELKTAEETAQFYTHDLSYLGEAQLCYSTSVSTDDINLVGALDATDVKSLLELYTKRRPPEGLEDFTDIVIDLGVSFSR